MNRFVFAILVFVFACEPVRVYECTNGVEGVEVAIAYASKHWPDVRFQTDALLVHCKPQETIETSINSCAMARVERPESCAVHRRENVGSHARIDISHDEDAAISTCHEVQHLRDQVWVDGNGCQSHLSDCNYDKDAVARCEQAVRDFRER